MMLRKFSTLALAAAFALFTSPALAAMQEIGGQPLEWPQWPINMGTLEDGTANTSCTMNTSTSRCAFVGRLWSPTLACRNGGSKNIQNAGFLAGTKSGTWTLQIEIDPISTGSGNPGVPTGTSFGSGLALATMLSSAVTANSFNMSPNFTAVGVVNCYQEFVEVLSFSAYTSGSLTTDGPFGTDPSPFGPGIISSSNGGSTYTAASVSAGGTEIPDVMFEADDGTYATFEGIMPLDYTSGQTSWNNGSTPLEYGLEFQTPFDNQEISYCANVSILPTANVTWKLTDEASTPNVLASTSLLGTQANHNGGTQGKTCIPMLVSGSSSRVTITRNTKYVFAMSPTTANNVSTMILNIPVGAINLLFGCGNLCEMVQRNTTSAAWGSPTQTQIPWWAVGIVAIDNATGQ
jgi:hypothetical protein